MRNYGVFVLVAILVLAGGCWNHGNASQETIIEPAEPNVADSVVTAEPNVPAEIVKPEDIVTTPEETVNPEKIVKPEEVVKPTGPDETTETVKKVKTAGPEFFEAALNGQIIPIKTAIDEGVNINSLDSDERSALMLASFDGHTDIVKLLIKNGADVNLVDNFGRTALMFAASGDNAETVKILLENKAKVNVADGGERFTALMFAAAEGQLEVVRLLLKYNANWKMVDVDGDNARKFANDNGHRDVVELIDAYAALKAKDESKSDK